MANSSIITKQKFGFTEFWYKLLKLSTMYSQLPLILQRAPWPGVV